MKSLKTFTIFTKFSNESIFTNFRLFCLRKNLRVDFELVFVNRLSHVQDTRLIPFLQKTVIYKQIHIELVNLD